MKREESCPGIASLPNCWAEALATAFQINYQDVVIKAKRLRNPVTGEQVKLRQVMEKGQIYTIPKVSPDMLDRLVSHFGKVTKVKNKKVTLARTKDEGKKTPTLNQWVQRYARPGHHYLMIIGHGTVNHAVVVSQLPTGVWVATDQAVEEEPVSSYNRKRSKVQKFWAFPA